MKGPDDFFLVRLPTVVDTWKVTAANAFSEFATNRLPVHAVWRDAANVAFLVDGRGLKHNERVHVYPLPAPSSPPAPVANDPLPLRGRAARTAGMDVPSSWQQVLTLQTCYDAAPRPFAAASFEGLPATFKAWYRGDWIRKNHLVELHTWLLVPADTRLSFGLAGTAPAWLFIDGSNTLVHPPGQPYERWTSADPIPVKAGLREVGVVSVIRDRIDTGLAWKRPGETNVATDVRMVTGGLLRDGRWERRGVRPSLFARAVEGRAYRFAEKPAAVFVPYTFIDRSYGVSTNVSRWQIDGRAAGTGRKFAAVLDGTNVHTARLENAGAFFDLPPLSWSGRLWREERVSVSARGVPAFCFDDASVAPILSVRTTAPDNTPFVLRIASFPNGEGSSPAVQDYPVAPKGGKTAVYLPPFEVSTVERISWTLLHEGVALKSGQLLFPVSKPRDPRAGFPRAYDILPDAYSGETLLAAGDYLCYLVPRATAWRFGAPSVPAPDTPADLLVTEGRAWEALAGDFPRRLAAGTGLKDCGNPGLALFAALASATGTVQTAVEDVPSDRKRGVVYAPEARLEDFADLDAFACRVSAMLGMLAAPAFGNAPVTVLVPPVPDTLPDCGCAPAEGGIPCPHAARMREASERVLRAADTRGVRALDLYTLFQTADSEAPLFSHGRLTSEGARLARTAR